MEFSNLTLTVTEDCNFRCSYCYQSKRKKYLDLSPIKNAIEFFFPFLNEECYIHFYGGEPLLAFDQIREAVDYIQIINKENNKRVRYTISTNGSLLNEEILNFLSCNKFFVLLSFDGFAQDITKKKGSFNQIVSKIEELLKTPHIELETNSVFTEETIGYLSKSIQFLCELGVPNIDYVLSKIIPWKHSSLKRLKKELAFLRGLLLSIYTKTQYIPLVDFREDSRKGIFSCSAGKDRMALMPDGKLWGCDLFADYYKERIGTKEFHKYCFGDLNSFVQNYKKIYPGILANYSNLRMDRNFTQGTRCIECKDLGSCGSCPVDNLFSSSDIRKIAPWACEIKKIFRQEKKLFWKELEGVG